MASIDLLRSQYPNTPDDILLAAADMQDAESSMPMRGDLSSESAMRKFAGRSDDGVKTSDAASEYPGVSDSGDSDLEDVLSSMGGGRITTALQYRTDDPDLDEVLSTIGARSDGRPTGASIGGGFKRAFAQIPELGYGAGALAGMTAEKIFGDGGVSTGVKDYFTRKYQEKRKENEQYAPGIQFTDAWDAVKAGNLDPLADWLKDAAGYVVGQGVQTVLTGGAGAIIGKTVLKSGTEKMLGALVAKGAEKIVEKSAGKIAMEQATQISAKRLAEGIGAGIALNAQNLGMEAGDIFGELKDQAEKEGREITGDDLARAWGAAGAAALTETATDLLGLGTLAGKIQIPGVRGRAARGAVAAGVGVPLEGGQEYVQTGLEQYGAGKPLNTQDAELERVNAAAVGAVGGGLMGAGAGAMSRQAERKQPTEKDILDAPTIDAAVDAAVGASETLGLPYYAGEPLVTFPDGSTMTRAEAEQQRLSDMVQPAAAPDTIQNTTPQPVVAMDSQPSSEEQRKRDEIEAAFKQQEAERNAQKLRDLQAMRREQLAQQADAESSVSLANDQQPMQRAAMQLAMDRAEERNREPVSKPGEAPQESPVLSLANSRRGSPVITGPADAVRAAEPYIRASLPGETIFVQKDESGTYALVFGRNADRAKIREVIANVPTTMEAPPGNERRGLESTTQEKPNGLQVQGQAPAKEVDGSFNTRGLSNVIEVNDAYGTTHRVLRSDLDSGRYFIRTVTRDGKRKGRIARDDIDFTGEKQKARVADISANPLFNVITAKNGRAFSSEASAKAAAKRAGVSGTHEVIHAGLASPGETGFVLRRKRAEGRADESGQLAEHAQSGSEAGSTTMLSEKAGDSKKSSDSDMSAAAPSAQTVTAPSKGEASPPEAPAIPRSQSVGESSGSVVNDSLTTGASNYETRTASLEDIPPRILKKVKVKVERMVGNEVETEEVSATEAISDIDQEISAYESLLKCLRSAA